MAATVDSHECREKERTLQLPLISSYPFTLVTMGLCSGLGFGDGCIVSSTDPGPGPTGIYAYGGMSYEWAEMWLGLDARYTCNTDCTLSTYCDAEDGSGQFFARRVEWRAHISGLAANASHVRNTEPTLCMLRTSSSITITGCFSVSCISSGLNRPNSSIVFL